VCLRGRRFFLAEADADFPLQIGEKFRHMLKMLAFRFQYRAEEASFELLKIESGLAYCGRRTACHDIDQPVGGMKPSP